MPRIDEMYAFIAEDTGPDDEGIVGFTVGNNWIPMVGGDMARIESLKPIAALVSARTGQKIKIVKFTNREEIEEICPNID